MAARKDEAIENLIADVCSAALDAENMADLSWKQSDMGKQLTTNLIVVLEDVARTIRKAVDEYKENTKRSKSA